MQRTFRVDLLSISKNLAPWRTSMSSSMTPSDQITEYYEPLSTSCVKIKKLRCKEARLERDQTEDQRLEARGMLKEVTLNYGAAVLSKSICLKPAL